MIFVTIGSQEPFDRLIKEIDRIAPDLPGVPIVAQVAKGSYKVKNIKSLSFIPPKDFAGFIKEAKLIISHAGMGTIISVLEEGKPIIIVPRFSKFKETRNDHQVATAKAFAKNELISVIYDENDLLDKIRTLYYSQHLPVQKIGKQASPELIRSIKEFKTGFTTKTLVNE